MKWYFVTKNQNCSDLLWERKCCNLEKLVLKLEKIFGFRNIQETLENTLFLWELEKLICVFCPMYDFGKQMLVGSEKNACLEKLMSLYMRISICSMSENSFTMGLGANSLTQAFTMVKNVQYCLRITRLFNLMSIVLYICFSCWLLAHESRN